MPTTSPVRAASPESIWPFVQRYIDWAEGNFLPDSLWQSAGALKQEDEFPF